MKFFYTWVALVLCLLPTTCLLAQPFSRNTGRIIHPLLQMVLQEQSTSGTGKTEASSPVRLKQLANFYSVPIEQKGGITLFHTIILSSNPGALVAAGVPITTVFGKYATARLTAGQIRELAGNPLVQEIAPAKQYKLYNDDGAADNGANLLHAGYLNGTSYTGKGVIVMTFDTGIDWQHLDFRKQGDTAHSRILYLWDQNLKPEGMEKSPTVSGLTNPYGVEYTQQDIENGFGNPRLVRHRDTVGHGTHVMGTAAGNGQAAGGKRVGMAPEADLIVVTGDLSSTNTINAINYGNQRALQLGKPLVINFSFGSDLAPKDGSDPDEQYIDQLVNATPGRAIAVAMGNNAGGTRFVGNTHYGTQVGSGGNSFPFTVENYSKDSLPQHDALELVVFWDDTLNLVSPTLISPTGIKYTLPTPTTTSWRTSGSYLEDGDGTVQLLYDTWAAGSNKPVLIYIIYNGSPDKLPAVGNWQLNLKLVNGAPFRADAYLASLNVPVPLPAFFTGGDNLQTIGSPASARGAISVAAHAVKVNWLTGRNNVVGVDAKNGTTDNIAAFSSLGPTRDGRQKPDISASGVSVVSAFSRYVQSYPANADGPSGPDDFAYSPNPNHKYWTLQGTSMATPTTAGSVALLFQASPTLTTAQVKALLTGSATQDAFTAINRTSTKTSTAQAPPNTTWGYGKLNVLAAMVKLLNNSNTAQREVIDYDVHSAYTGAGIASAATLNGAPNVALTGTTRFAVRFTPDVTGVLTGVTLETAVTDAINYNTQPGTTNLVQTSVQGTGNLLIQLYTDNAGLPGQALGSQVTVPISGLLPGSLNSINTTAAGTTVVQGANYHLVLALSQPGDRVLLSTDKGEGPTNRSSVFAGGIWQAFGTPSPATTAGTNLRLHSVVDASSLTSCAAAIYPLGPTSLCNGSVRLLANSLPGATYSWYQGAGQVATGPNNFYDASAAGAYTVHITGAAGCTPPASWAINVSTSACAGPPTITSLSLASGPVGTAVVLTGTGFTGATQVAVGGAPASFTVASATSISLTIPAGAQSGSISVTAPAGTGTSTTFTVTVGPVITSFSPSSGVPSSTVVIKGSGFTGATQVDFGGTPAAFSVINDGTLTATVPNGTATQAVVIHVTNGTVASSITNFSILNSPQIISFYPGQGGVGTSGTVIGSGFTNASQVLLNGYTCTFEVVTDKELTFTVPMGATTGLVQINAPGGSISSTNPFEVVPGPQLLSYNPQPVWTGGPLSVVGYNLASHGARVQDVYFVTGTNNNNASVFSAPFVVAAGQGTTPDTIKGLSVPGSLYVDSLYVQTATGFAALGIRVGPVPAGAHPADLVLLASPNVFNSIFNAPDTYRLGVSDPDEGGSKLLPIGFNFPYLGGSYTHFSVTANGTLHLGLPATGYNRSIGDGLLGVQNVQPRPLLAPFYSDIYLANPAGDVVAQLQGTTPNRVLTVEWNNAYWASSAQQPALSFQAKLYESGRVDYLYSRLGTTVASNSPVAIGLTNGATDKHNFVTLVHRTVHPDTSSFTGTSADSIPPTGYRYTFAPTQVPVIADFAPQTVFFNDPVTIWGINLGNGTQTFFGKTAAAGQHLLAMDTLQAVVGAVDTGLVQVKVVATNAVEDTSYHRLQVHFKDLEGLQLLYPNPATTFSTVYVVCDKPEPAALQVFTADGRLVTATTVLPELSSGLNRCRVNVANLATGLYVVRLQQQGFDRKYRLVVSER